MTKYIPFFLNYFFNYKLVRTYSGIDNSIFNYKICKEIHNLICPFIKDYKLDIDNDDSFKKNNQLFELILEEYSFLEILIAKKLENHDIFRNKFISDLNTFIAVKYDQNVVVVNLEMTLADPHNFGKINLIVALSNGKKWVYKSRSSLNEINYNNLVNSFYEALSLKKQEVEIHNFIDFSFCEYISHIGCPSEEGISEYYYRIGIQLFLLWHLDASDINHENLIAHAEFPIIIDLEVVMPPNYNIKQYPPRKIFAESVMKVLLLPEWRKVGANSYTNMSGLSDTQSSLNYLYDHFPSKHMPYHGCIKKSAVNYSKHVEKGFEKAFNIYLEKQSYFNSIIGGFEFSNRIILKPTAFYRNLFEKLNLPEYLGALTNQLDIINNTFKGVSKKILDYEKKCILSRNIPIYNSKSRSTDLYFDDCLIENYFQTCGREIISTKIVRFKDLSFQLRLIQLALESLNRRPIKPAPLVSISNQEMNLNKKICEVIISQIYNVNGVLLWIQKNNIGNGFYNLKPSGIDLLEGNTGIVFSLIISSPQNKDKFKDIALTILKQDYHYINAMNNITDTTYLKSHLLFITKLITYIESFNTNPIKIIDAFFDFLKNNKTSIFAKTITFNGIQKPLVDVTNLPVHLLIPQLLNSLKEKFEFPKMFIENVILNTLKREAIEEIKLSSGLSGLLLILTLSKTMSTVKH